MNLNGKLASALTLAALTLSSAQAIGTAVLSGSYQIEDDIHKTFYFTPTRANLFEEDATDPANLRLSQDTLREIVRADVEKEMTKYSNSGLASKGTLRNTDSITNKIMWAAECTGNDPIVLASIIGNESAYCFFTKSLGGGGDSGCGQFVGTAIKALKQATGNAKEEVYRQVTEPVQAMAERCSRGSSFVEPNSLKNFFAKSTDAIKADLVAGKNLSLDIMSTAIFLKILYASAKGEYYNPEVERRAIWRYNGGGVKKYNEHVYINRACKLNSDMAHCPTEI